ncbi:MerR family transcriptional regulator [Enterococcus crotali]|uniref:MerR family transcriptional regulator n=1 Tax=Enterococcus crotali TaxID=1453587 RepID=UPI000B1ABB24|nr:MerR family transcriptional regulator [Enterococcus crotali]
MKYKINEFSKMTAIPKSTLRYYDREGLLIPSLRDQENGYRYYDEADFKLANQLTLLRNSDFSISEIKEVLRGVEEDGDLAYYLLEKKTFILEEIQEKKRLMKKIDQMITLRETDFFEQEYNVELHTKSAQRVITRKCTCAFDQMGLEVNYLYQAAKDAVAGELFTSQREMLDEKIQYEIVLPVNRFIESKHVENEVFPEMVGLRTFHYGAYQEIGQAYKILIDHVEQNQLETDFAFINTFIKGSGKKFKGNQAKYITEIFLPIK